jgi:pimeloyl-ACP methyl ester carboxylesterase
MALWNLVNTDVINLVDKYTNKHSRFLPIRGTLIHYRVEGNGPNLLLLHGSFSSLHTFDPWVSQLAEKYRVIRLDLPGFGLTGPNADQCYTMQSFLFYIQTFAKMLDLGTFSLGGSSLGGWLAWEYALKHPEQVDKLILIDAAGFIDEDNLPLPFRMARTPFFNRVIKFAIRRTLLEEFVREVYYNKSKVTEQLIDRYYDLFTREGNPEAFLILVNGKFKDNTRALKQLKQPTLIMWGKEDRWLPVENAYKFHDFIPKNDMVIYDRVGHLPMEEIPEDTASDVDDFLQGR